MAHQLPFQTESADTMPKTNVLNYANAMATQRPKPSFLLVTRLAMPGAICWFCYFFLLLLRENGILARIILAIAAVMVYPAVVCAAVSVQVFIRIRRTAYPWYVIVNLLINISGLAFVFSDYLSGCYKYICSVYDFVFQYWL